MYYYIVHGGILFDNSRCGRRKQHFAILPVQCVYTYNIIYYPIARTNAAAQRGEMVYLWFYSYVKVKKNLYDYFHNHGCFHTTLLVELDGKS